MDEHRVQQQDTIKTLIEVVRSYPEIYAVGHSEYRNGYKKAVAWKRVKEKTGMNVKKLKIKWKNLRDTYRKHKLCLLMGNKATSKLSNWIWANEMSFIEPYIKFKPIESSSNISVDSSDSEENDKTEEENEQHEPKNNPSPEPEIVKSVRKPAKRKRHESHPDPAVNVMTNINPEVYKEKGPDNVVEVPCDRTDMEFLGYANTMKSLSLRSQALIKLQITKILTQYQLEELSPTTPVCNEEDSYMTNVQLTDLQPYFIDIEQKHTPGAQS